MVSYEDYTNGLEYGVAQIHYNDHTHTLQSFEGGISLYAKRVSPEGVTVVGSVGSGGTIELDTVPLNIPAGICALYIHWSRGSDIKVDVCGAWQAYVDITDNMIMARRWTYGCDDIECHNAECCYNTIGLYSDDFNDCFEVAGLYGNYKLSNTSNTSNTSNYLALERDACTEIHVLKEGKTFTINEPLDKLIFEQGLDGAETLVFGDRRYNISDGHIRRNVPNVRNAPNVPTPAPSNGKKAHLSLKFRGPSTARS